MAILRGNWNSRDCYLTFLKIKLEMGNIKQDNLYLYPLLHGSLAAKPCSAMGLEWGNCFMKVRMSHIGGRGVWPTDLSWHWELCRLSSNLMNLSMTYLILVSVPGPNPSFFHFWRLLVNLGVCWDRGLDLDLDQGLTACWSCAPPSWWSPTYSTWAPPPDPRSRHSEWWMALWRWSF